MPPRQRKSGEDHVQRARQEEGTEQEAVKDAEGKACREEREESRQVRRRSPALHPPGWRTDLRTARKHGASGAFARPVRALLRESFAPRLLLVGPAHHIQQFLYARDIALLRTVDGLLGQVVAQYEPGVRRIHARAPD